MGWYVTMSGSATALAPTAMRSQATPFSISMTGLSSRRCTTLSLRRPSVASEEYGL